MKLEKNNISIKLRLRLVKCYILPVLTYNCETWTFNKNTEKRIEAFEMWLYRRLGKISWTEKFLIRKCVIDCLFHQRYYHTYKAGN